jgi:WS/DGAT/MGAT family acyltransferase
VADTPVQPAKLAYRLTTQDASFLYGESHNGPLHIGSLAVFEGEISFEQMKRHVELRLHLIPRYRQRLSFVPFNLAHPTWEDDPNFTIDRHLMHHQLAEGASEDDLIDAAMAVYEVPLAFDRPVWEMHLFGGLWGGRSAVLWKTHHCLVDGVSGMELLNVVLDFRPDAPPPEQPENPWRPAPFPGRGRSFVRAAFDRVQEQLGHARQATELIPSRKAVAETARPIAGAVRALAKMATSPIVAAPWSSGLVTQERSLAWLKISFTDTRTIRTAIGGTVNDVVLTILAEGAARYLEYHGTPIDGRPLRIGCPVNVRRKSESGGLGNRVSMMFPEFEATPMDAVARLELVAKETERRKSSGEPQALEMLMSASDLVPPVLMGLASGLGTAALDTAVRLLRHAPPGMARRFAPPAAINFVATNVPGAQVPLFLGGHRMIDYVGLVPLGANLGYGVAILSYNQNLYFGMIAEPRLMPDVEQMKHFVSEVFEELKAAAQERAAVPAAREQDAPVKAPEPVQVAVPSRPAKPTLPPVARPSQGPQRQI